MKKQQPQTVEQDLNAYRVRITVSENKKIKSSATFESFSGNWKIAFFEPSGAMSTIVCYFNEKDWDRLEAIARTLYELSNASVVSDTFTTVLNAVLEKSYQMQAERGELNPTTETDKEILQQEKLKYEFQEQLLNENGNR